MMPSFFYDYVKSQLVVINKNNIEYFPLTVKEANSYIADTYGVPVEFKELVSNPPEQE